MAHALSEPAAAGLSRLEVSRNRPVAGTTAAGSSELVLQVHEQACDEQSWALRPHHHHERRHPGLLSEGRLVQTGLLPPVLLLLSLRVRLRLSVGLGGASQSRMGVNHDGPYLFFPNRMIYVLVSS